MTRKFVILATAALIVLGVVMWQLGLRAQNELQTVTTDQFNRQQLILAQKVAQDIEQHFTLLRTSLLELTTIWSKHPTFMSSPERALPAFQEILRSSEVLAIGLRIPGQRDRDPLPRGRGHARTADPGLRALSRLGPQSGPQAGTSWWACANPPWKVPSPARPSCAWQPGIGPAKPDSTSPEWSSWWSMPCPWPGATPTTSGPGRTGYAWVLDQRGIFSRPLHRGLHSPGRLCRPQAARPERELRTGGLAHARPDPGRTGRRGLVRLGLAQGKLGPGQEAYRVHPGQARPGPDASRYLGRGRGGPGGRGGGHHRQGRPAGDVHGGRVPGGGVHGPGHHCIFRLPLVRYPEDRSGHTHRRTARSPGQDQAESAGTFANPGEAHPLRAVRGSGRSRGAQSPTK